MKKIIYLLTGLLLVAACSNKEIMIYELEDDGIQFVSGRELKFDFDFSFQYETSEDEWGYKVNHYYGDALRDTTIKMVVSLMGWPSDADRSFRLKAVEGEDLNPELVGFEESYTFRANQLTDTLAIVLHRPAERGSFEVQVTFDVEGPDNDFVLGAEERVIYTFNITDRYPKPRDWDMKEAWIGEYSEEKYAFMVTVMRKLFSPWHDWDAANATLRTALDEYNAANPDNPKDFTFPEYPVR